MKKIAISINLDWPLKRYHDLYAGIQEYNKKTKWLLVWDHYPEIYLKKSTTNSYYDGIIGRIKYDAYKEAVRLNVPMVNTWATSNLVDLIPSVLVDYKEGGRVAARYLLKRGFTNFVNIDYRVDKGCKDFFDGFSESIKSKASLKKHLFNRNCDESMEQWEIFHNNFASWVKHWKFPVAIVTAVSAIGPKITTRLIEHGINIPDQAAVLTFDNDLIYCESHSPKISSIDVDYFKVGYEAAKMLDAQLSNKELTERKIFITPSTVVTRDSTDTFAVEDEITKSALKFISDNFYKNISVDDIVKKVPIGRRALEIRFKEIVGHSICDEINRLRITTLKKILSNSDDKINLIYKELGFSSDQNLRRVFKSFTGMTPTEYKESLSKKNL